MPTFKPCVRKQRSDGFFAVYIRIVHNRKTDYIKTDKIVNAKGLTKTKDIKDPIVMKYCMQVITDYIDTLNRVEVHNWSVKEIKEFLLNSSDDLSFSEFARKHVDRMIDNGQVRNAKNYQLAYKHLERFSGTNNVLFSHLTSGFVERWIESLSATKRAKEMYPICIRQIFRAAIVEYNDYDTGVIRVKTNPWVKVKIPTADTTRKLAISADKCREFFFAPLPESKMVHPTEELGRDVAMMILCLAGINTIDIYEMRKSEYAGGVLHYNRKKTYRERRDNAYIEMRVPPVLESVFAKYVSDDPEDEYLFTFHNRFTTSDSFSAGVNVGIRRLCESMGIPKKDWYCAYTFRHTWGTIAQNDCGASISDVAFAMNHSQGFTVTRGYLKIDFTPAWELNEKVVDFIFFSDNKSKRDEGQEDTRLHLSPKYLVHGELFYRGTLLHTLEDIGFNNKEEVIAELVKYVPDYIPDGTAVLLRIENKDKNQVAVYERTKGKGF